MRRPELYFRQQDRPELEFKGVSVEHTYDKHYAYEQMTPAAEWEITHNLGKYPAVTVVDSAGTEVVGDVRYIDNNSLTVTFSGAFAGKAYMN